MQSEKRVINSLWLWWHRCTRCNSNLLDACRIPRSWENVSCSTFLNNVCWTNVSKTDSCNFCEDLTKRHKDPYDSCLVRSLPVDTCCASASTVVFTNAIVPRRLASWLDAAVVGERYGKGTGGAMMESWASMTRQKKWIAGLKNVRGGVDWMRVWWCSCEWITWTKCCVCDTIEKLRNCFSLLTKSSSLLLSCWREGLGVVAGKNCGPQAMASQVWLPKGPQISQTTKPPRNHTANHLQVELPLLLSFVSLRHIMSASKKQKTTEHVILVTGASGLVGRAIQSVVNSPDHVPVGNERWVFLSSKDGDLRDPAATQAIFEKHNPTHVIHLAAFVGGLFKNMQFGVQFFEDNMHMTMNVLKMAVSSGQVFGSSTRSFCLFVGSNVLVPMCWFQCVVPMCCSNVLFQCVVPMCC